MLMAAERKSSREATRALRSRKEANMPDKREIRGPIRVGIVGLGNWAKYGHIPVLNYGLASFC